MAQVLCDVCDKELKLYFTSNVCEECCKTGNCPSDDFCENKYPEYKKRTLGQRMVLYDRGLRALSRAKESRDRRLVKETDR